MELEKTLEGSFDSKEIKPVHLKGNQSWIFTGGTGAKAEAPVLWKPDVKSLLEGVWVSFTALLPTQMPGAQRILLLQGENAVALPRRGPPGPAGKR